MPTGRSGDSLPAAAGGPNEDGEAEAWPGGEDGIVELVADGAAGVILLLVRHAV